MRRARRSRTFTAFGLRSSISAASRVESSSMVKLRLTGYHPLVPVLCVGTRGSIGLADLTMIA